MQNKELNYIDIEWMKKALNLAKKASSIGEVPVGALIVKDHIMIGRGYNSPISCCDPTAHAEILALREATLSIKNYRLSGATLYVTIEPCTMCIGAIIHARIARLVYGALEPRAGAVVSNLELPILPHYNHRLDVQGGVIAEECGALISNFFKNKRSLT